MLDESSLRKHRGIAGNYSTHGFERNHPVIFEVTHDRMVVQERAGHARFETVCRMRALDMPADAAAGEVLL